MVSSHLIPSTQEMEAGAPGCKKSNGVYGDHDNVVGFNREEGSAQQAQDKEGEEEEFEFGCVTRPDSPTKGLGKNSPADHFFNGRLLPHSFKAATQPNAVGGGRPSSASSRDSLSSTLSSRSSSANSRSSTSSSSSSGSGGGSSARTSSSDSSERRIWTQSKLAEAELTTPRPPPPHQQPVVALKMGASSNGKAAAVKAYAPAQQKWQFIAPLPADSSRGKRNQKPAKKQQKEEKTAAEKSVGIGRRVFRSFVAACRECHSMEPTPKGKLTELQLESN